ncbi:MAG: hypothetical protein WDN28_15665 [Chthoniobacter sp.]
MNIANGAGFGVGVYRLFNYTGTLTDNTLDFGTLPSGFTYTIDLSTANPGESRREPDRRDLYLLERDAHGAQRRDQWRRRHVG